MGIPFKGWNKICFGCNFFFFVRLVLPMGTKAVVFMRAHRYCTIISQRCQWHALNTHTIHKILSRTPETIYVHKTWAQIVSQRNFDKCTRQSQETASPGERWTTCYKKRKRIHCPFETVMNPFDVLLSPDSHRAISRANRTIASIHYFQNNSNRTQIIGRKIDELRLLLHSHWMNSIFAWFLHTPYIFINPNDANVLFIQERLKKKNEANKIPATQPHRSSILTDFMRFWIISWYLRGCGLKCCAYDFKLFMK